LGAPPAGKCICHDCLSWTRLLVASVSKQRMCRKQNSVNCLNPSEEGLSSRKLESVIGMTPSCQRAESCELNGSASQRSNPEEPNGDLDGHQRKVFLLELVIFDREVARIHSESGGAQLLKCILSHRGQTCLARRLSHSERSFLGRTVSYAERWVLECGMSHRAPRRLTPHSESRGLLLAQT